ncbi:TVP38/TMEM64 family protein [Fenollaria sporofastidiosus]|uniref:TVP38/TMEM64 family protein n=1 Tax=Fenollaria sporofastidiosus TaxID=2811778 RepID=UPI001C001F12|nr:TVP38/TMEM64 family protein [Fenollaria sporofastidiosus]
MKKKTISKIVLIAIILLTVLLYFVVPSFHATINNFVSKLGSLNLDAVIELIRGYGAYAAVVSFFLMILQSILSPIPALLITLSNAAIFGWWKGALLSFWSAMAGAALCFYIARTLGRDVVEKITTKTGLAKVDEFFERYGKNSILICRLLPFVSFDIVSYAAGLTPIKFWDFFIATGLGQLPATIVYSYLGNLAGSTKTIFISIVCVVALSALVYMIGKIYNDKKKANKSN